MSLKRIRLELARTAEFPEGSAQHGYEFVAPLTADGHIDKRAWQHMKDTCEVTRFWEGGPEERGLLRHTRKGWLFDYDKEDDADDEPFFKLERHAFTPGAYVSLTEHDDVQRPFRVVSVASLN
jgi:hypothetical protein